MHKSLISLFVTFTILFVVGFLSFKLIGQDFTKEYSTIFITFLISILFVKLERMDENSNAFFFYMEDKIDEFTK